MKAIIHHFGGLKYDPLAKTQHFGLDRIEASHRQRFGMKSSLGYWTGYHFVILKEGRTVQTRAIREEGAHTKGHNFDLGIALAGNFNSGSGEYPTQEQTKALDGLLRTLYEGGSQYKGRGKIGLFAPPHRYYSVTDCYGSSLPDDFGTKMLVEYVKWKLGKLTQILLLYHKVLDLLKPKKLGGKDAGCYV